MKSRDRFQEIIRVFISYGFGYLIDSKFNDNKKSPENLRKAFEELGPTFIKIGQILSTRPDLLSEEYIKELVKLQDSAPEENFESINSIFEESFNKKIEESFIYFSKEPIASASISQVHEAILNNGMVVIVKVQKPDIYAKMKTDINILKKIFKLFKGRLNIDIFDPLEVLEEIEATTERELDFISESKNIIKFKESNENMSSIYAPNVIESLCSKKVLTLEYINGFKINNMKMIKEEGYNNKEIAKKLALSYCKQIFQDGFFHGDPHPGNLIISEGKICFIDFGIVGELNNELKEWLNKIIIAVALEDKHKIVDFILAVGVKRGKVDKGKLYEDISYLFTTYLNTSLKNIKMAVLLEEIFDIVHNNNIQFPKELTILFRALVILEGVVSEVDPDLDIISVITTFVKGKNKLSLLHEEDLSLYAYSFLRSTFRMPKKLIEALSNISDGRAKINLNINELNSTLNHISIMVNKLVIALIISSLIISSALIMVNNIGPTYEGVSIIGIIGYIIVGIFSVILLIAIIKDGGFINKKKK